MPWVHSHRRRTPYSWFRSTTVRSHYRRRPGALPFLPIAIAVVVILALVTLL